MGAEHQEEGATQVKRSPLGLQPRYVWRLGRIQDIVAAITRYQRDSRKVPDAWHIELHELLADPKSTFTLSDDCSWGPSFD